MKNLQYIAIFYKYVFLISSFNVVKKLDIEEYRNLIFLLPCMPIPGRKQTDKISYQRDETPMPAN